MERWIKIKIQYQGNVQIDNSGWMDGWRERNREREIWMKMDGWINGWTEREGVMNENQ